MPTGSRRSTPALWVATQLIVLALPLLIAVRLASEIRGPMDRVVAGTLLVSTTVPWATALGLVLGVFDGAFVPASRADDASARVRASSLRMLAVLAVAPASLWLVQPPDLLEFASVWRGLGAWLAVGAVPLWSTALLCRARGRGRLASSAIALGLAAALVSVTTLAGRAVFLDASATVAPLAAAGLIASIGVYLAVAERVNAPLGRVLAASYGLAIGTAVGLALVLSRPPMGAAWVLDYTDVDPVRSLVTVRVDEPNTTGRMAELNLESGAVRPLPRRIHRVKYAVGHRVELWGTWRGVLTQAPSAGVPCRVDAEGERVCAAVRLDPGSQPMEVHPRRPLVLFGDSDLMLVWDLSDDRAWKVQRSGRVRWPCFTDDGDVIWRMQTEDGPFLNERLRVSEAPAGTASAPKDVSSAVQALPLDHSERCARDSPVLTEATFVRGREAAGRASMMAGPGIPGGVHPIDQPIGSVAWSADGRTAAIALRNPHRVLFYQEGVGVTAGGDTDSLIAPELSRDGRWLVYRVGGSSDPYAMVVRSVPDGAVRLRTITESAKNVFDGRGRVLIVLDGRLRTVDPATGADVAVFPPE